MYMHLIITICLTSIGTDKFSFFLKSKYVGLHKKNHHPTYSYGRCKLSKLNFHTILYAYLYTVWLQCLHVSYLYYVSFRSGSFRILYSVQQQEARVESFIKEAVKLRDNFAIDRRIDERTDRQTDV